MDITQNTDAKTLQTQAEQLAPYMAQAFKQLSKDVATVTKWGAGEFDYTQIYSMPVVYYEQSSGKTLRIQVLMSAIIKALEEGAREDLALIKESAQNAATSAANSEEAAAAAQEAAEQSAAAAEEQKNHTIDYLNTVKGDEQLRVNAELERIEAETSRANAESARAKAETSRANAESARVQAETDRTNAWAAWFENASTGVKALWAAWFNATKQAWSDWFGATESAGVRKTWTDWFTAVKNAWNEFNTTASQAETARVNAENTRRLQEVERVSAEQDRASEFATIKSDAAEAKSAANSAATKANSAAASANEATAKANTATANSDKQTALCKSATDLAEELNAHPQMQGENGNWWKWNTETNEYEDTGIIARGGGMYPMVRSRRNHVIWYDSTDGFKERIVRRRNHTIIKL